MGNTCIKNFYKKMPISEKCCICKKQRFIGGAETAFRISTQGCKICRLKKNTLILILIMKLLLQDIN